MNCMTRKPSTLPIRKTAIVKGNIKLGEGNTWNVNLPPIMTCQDMPCYKEGCCYNGKAWRLWPSVRKSWMNNWNHYKENPVKFFNDIILRIRRAKKPPKFFRWHAAGEIPDQNYYDGMVMVAELFPHIKFLAFTKNYSLAWGIIPKNFQVVISAWPGVRLPKVLRDRFPVAWMEDGREKRYKRNPVACSGFCPTCRHACWGLSKMKRDVVFPRH